MKIAITGSIGSGKSLVGSYLRSLGYTVIDTDTLVHEFYGSSNILYQAVVDVFGLDVLGDAGEIDRKKLGQRVFSDALALNDLESIVHPAVADYIQTYNAEGVTVFFEVPMLFESEMDEYFDSVLMIDVDEDLSLERLVLRGTSRGDALSRLKHQMDPKLKIEKSSTVIHNNSSIDDLYRNIDAYLEELGGVA